MLRLPNRTTRRAFAAAAGGSIATAWKALADPPQAAVDAAGVKKSDFADMTIKEVKVYVAKLDGVHQLNNTETGEIVSIVSAGGVEGDYTIGNWSATTGWLEWAKPALAGKSVLDLLPAITATSGLKSSYGPDIEGRGDRGGAGRSGGNWPRYYTATAEIALWDVMGKTAGRPVYKLLGGTKDSLPAYASSQHLANRSISDRTSREPRRKAISDPRSIPAKVSRKTASRSPGTSVIWRRSSSAARRQATTLFRRTIRCSHITRSKL